MNSVLREHKTIFKPLLGVSIIAVIYLLNSSDVSGYEFWSPLLSFYWGVEGVFMPDIEVAEKLFKFLLNII